MQEDATERDQVRRTGSDWAGPYDAVRLHAPREPCLNKHQTEREGELHAESYLGDIPLSRVMHYSSWLPAYQAVLMHSACPRISVQRWTYSCVNILWTYTLAPLPPPPPPGVLLVDVNAAEFSCTASVADGGKAWLTERTNQLLSPLLILKCDSKGTQHGR